MNHLTKPKETPTPNPKIKLEVDNGNTAPHDELFITLQNEFDAVFQKHCLDAGGVVNEEKAKVAEKAYYVALANIISQTECCMAHLIERSVEGVGYMVKETISQFQDRRKTTH